MTCSEPADRMRGFTLLEVIVAMLVATMIVTVVFSGLGVAFDAWAATTERIDALDRVRYARSALREQIREAIPLSTVVEEGLTRTQVIGFEGEPRAIRFVTTATFSLGPSGPARWVEWSVEENGIQVVEYDIVPPDNRPSQAPAFESRIDIGARTTDLEFQFLPPRSTFDPPDSIGEWVNDWDPRDRATIPQAVRIATTGTRGPEESFWMLIRLDYGDSARQGMRLQ